MQYHFTIWGHPVILKNSKNIVPLPVKGSKKCPVCGLRKTRPVPIPNKNYKAYQKHALLQLAWQWKGKQPIRERLQMIVVFFGAWKESNANYPDESNLIEAPQDILQEAGVINDDRQIDNHDGSHRVFLCDGPCPKKERYKAGLNKGQMKPDCGAVTRCPFERVEITLIGLPDCQARNEADYEQAYIIDEF